MSKYNHTVGLVLEAMGVGAPGVGPKKVTPVPDALNPQAKMVNEPVPVRQPQQPQQPQGGMQQGGGAEPNLDPEELATKLREIGIDVNGMDKADIARQITDKLKEKFSGEQVDDWMSKVEELPISILKELKGSHDDSEDDMSDIEKLPA